MPETFNADITETGFWDRDMVKYLKNIRDLVNELVDDHATFKTAVDNLNTLTDELRADHATTKTAVDELNTLTDELHDDHATFITLTNELHVDVDLITLAVDGVLGKMDADFADVTNASTDYEAVHGVGGSGAVLPAAAITAGNVATISASKATAGPATISAAEAAAGPAALSDSTDLKLTAG